MEWKTKTIGEIVQQIKTGSTPSTSNPEFFDGFVPWFTPSDIGIQSNLVKSSRYISEKGIKEGKAKLLEKRAILVTCIGDIGRVGILSQSASFNQQITGLTFLDEVDVDYAYYWFVKNPKKLEQKANKAIVPILNNDRLKEVEFSYPPLEEQKRIAAICTKADRLRRTCRYALELGDTYLRSVFLEMFGDPVENPKGWDKIIASEIFDIQLGKMLSAKNYTGTNLYPYLANMNVQWGYVDISEVREMDFDDREFQKFRLKFGDILVCEGGEAGRTAIWKGELKNCCFQKALHRLRPKKSTVKSEYFLHFMRQAVVRGAIKKESTLVTITHFTAERFAEFLVMLPPLPLQEKFAKIVHKSDRIRTQQREALRQAEHLFQTILHRAFSGEL